MVGCMWFWLVTIYQTSSTVYMLWECTMYSLDVLFCCVIKYVISVDLHCSQHILRIAATCVISLTIYTVHSYWHAYIHTCIKINITLIVMNITSFVFGYSNDVRWCHPYYVHIILWTVDTVVIYKLQGVRKKLKIL